MKLKKDADKWLLLIGIPIVSAIAIIVFANKDISGNYKFYYIHGFAATIVIWVGCRYIVKLLWDKYPWHIYPLKHLLVEIALTLIYLFITGSIFIYLNIRFVNPDFPQEQMVFSITFTILITFLIIAIHEGWYFFMQWKSSLVISEKLEKENLQARFETLKNQVNPHFLFNSLNTLMTYIDDNPKAVSFVQSLSDFFRYVLLTKDDEVVDIENEINILEKYIYLQKSRFGDNLEININIVTGKINSFFIPPLTLQMLVENAIKHNVISKKKPLYVDVYSDENECICVKNNLQRKKSISSTKIGLNNIKKRYNYLSEKEVIIKETDNVFLVSVPLLKIKR